VGELGPGDSLGIGLAAMLSGAEVYYALDIVPFAAAEKNLAILDELVALFRSRAPIPAADELPGVYPRLDSYDFPRALLSDERLDRALAVERVERIRRAILGKEPRILRYLAPWHDPAVVPAASLEMIYSQAVLEHVGDLPGVYRAMRRWLRPGGFISHEIDFSSHGYSDYWNGHWRFSPLVWRLITGGRPYSLNREPYSTHIRLVREAGFRIVLDEPHRRSSAITRRQLARQFRWLSDEDLEICGTFLQAVPAEG
jgi:hypothetical protein